MSEKYNSIGETLAYLIKLNKYAVQVLLKLNQAATSSDDTVTIQLQNSEGLYFDYKIPSFSNLDRRIKDIDRQLKKIYLIRDKDNNKDIFENELVHEPNLIKNVDVPNKFYSKPNYFFENLLNPLLYIKIPIDGKVTNNSKSILSRRVILKIDTDSKREFFQTYYNKKNNLDYDTVLDELKTQGIAFTFDEEILDLPPVILKYSGSFSVVNVGSEIINNSTFSSVRRYTLDTLEYNENVDNGTKITKVLKGGEELITTNGETHYSVVSVNQELNTVDLGLVYGYDIISQSSDALRISSPLSGDKFFHVSVGFDESQILFLKSIDNYNHITTQNWSDGIGFWSSDLNISTDDGDIPFNDYYLEQVNDYAKFFNNIIQEQNTPILEVIKPNPPTLLKENFQINQINGQTAKNIDVKRKAELVERRDLLETKRSTLNTTFSAYNKQYEEDPSLTTLQRTDLRNKLNAIMLEKADVVAEIVSLKQDIQVEVDKIRTGKIINPKFVIDGVWDIPILKVGSDNKLQYPTHFKIKATYLNAEGVTNSSPLIQFTKNDGNTTSCYIPVFNLYETHKRQMLLDDNGKLIPEGFDTSNPNFRTINQLPQGIPIDVTSGEKVQIEVRTCIETINSEIISDWSSPIIIDTPSTSIPQFEHLESIDTKLKYYYEMDSRADDVNMLLKQLQILTKKVSEVSSLKNFDSRGTIIYVLSEQDILNGNLYLPNILEFDLIGPDAIEVFVVGGIRGTRGSDYEIYDNSVFVFDGFLFGEQLTAGDKLSIRYTDYKL